MSKRKALGTVASTLAILLALAGCRAIGPPTIPRDRFDYSRTIADSWKQQTLLNIVKVRYIDLPIFLDVASIVSGYQFHSSASVGGTVYSKNSMPGTGLTLGVSGTYVDQPTITYAPKTGDKFLESLVKPISPARIFRMVQAGYAIDFILELTLESICGVRNRASIPTGLRQADLTFFEVLTLLREAQEADGFGMRIDSEGKESQLATALFFRRQGMSPEALEKLKKIKELLKLPPERDTFRLLQSPIRGEGDEFTVAPRSMLQILMALGQGVDIPQVHADRKLTPPKVADENRPKPLLHIYSGTEKPKNAYAAVPYEGAWFWIAPDDWVSKRSFVAIMFLFTMMESGQPEMLPVVTIPAR